MGRSDKDIKDMLEVLEKDKCDKCPLSWQCGFENGSAEYCCQVGKLMLRWALEDG